MKIQAQREKDQEDQRGFSGSSRHLDPMLAEAPRTREEERIFAKNRVFFISLENCLQIT